MKRELHFILEKPPNGSWTCNSIKVERDNGLVEPVGGLPGNAKLLELAGVFAVLKLRSQKQLPAEFVAAKDQCGELELHKTFRAQYVAGSKYLNEIFSPFGGKENVVKRSGQAEEGRIWWANGFTGDQVKFLGLNEMRIDISVFLKETWQITVSNSLPNADDPNSIAQLLLHQKLGVAGVEYPVAETQERIRKAIDRDFSQTTIDEQEKVNREAVLLLGKAGISRQGLTPNAGSVPVNTLATQGIVPPDNQLVLRQFPEITVTCLANIPAGIATLKQMQKILPLHIFYYELVGRGMADSLANRPFDFDILATAQQGLHFGANASVLKYKHLLTMHTMSQILLTNGKKPRFPKVIYYHPETSQQEAAMSLKENLKRRGFKVELRECSFISILERNLNDGEGVIVWSPTRAPDGWVQVPNIKLTSARLCLYAHESWFSKDKVRQLTAFRNGFIATWTQMKRDPEDAQRLLIADTDYQKYFALATGIAKR